jgi:hypothetical protein
MLQLYFSRTTLVKNLILNIIKKWKENLQFINSIAAQTFKLPSLCAVRWPSGNPFGQFIYNYW